MYNTIHGITHITGTNTDIPNCTIPNNKSVNAGGNQTTSQGNGSHKHIKWFERLVNDSANYSVFAVQQHINDMFNVYWMLEVQPELDDSSQILKHFHHIAKNGHIGTLVNIENTLAGGQLSQSNSNLASITPQNDIESNYIDFYNVYIHYKDSTYSVADSIMLKTLVEGCPVRDGMAVRKARTLYSMIYRDFTLYPDNCIDNNSTKMSTNLNNEKTKPANLSLDVYPNPSTNSFIIDINFVAEKPTKIFLYNAIGTAIKEIINGFVQSQLITVDVKDLPTGNYFIRIETDKQVYIKKIIILKQE